MAQSTHGGRARLLLPERHLAESLGGGEERNDSVLVAIYLNQDVYREVLGVAEDNKKNKASWQNYLRHLASRGV